jgi:hypothetical protein
MSQPDVLTISSYNATEQERASDFTAVLGNTIIYPKGFSVVKFTMPNMIYDISPYYAKFKIGVFQTASPATVTTATATVSTTTHFATGAAFCTDVLTKVNAACVAAGAAAAPLAATTGIAFATDTGKVTITAATGWKFFLYDWENPNGIDAQSVLYKMGFTSVGNVSGYNTAANAVTSLTGDSNLNLIGTSIIYIASNLLGNAQNDKKSPDGTTTGDASILCAIPVNADFGSMIIYQDQFSYFIDTNINSLRSIKITLLDEEYNILTLPRGCYATLELRIKY